MLIGQEPLVPPPGVHTFPQETPAPKRVLGPGARSCLVPRQQRSWKAASSDASKPPCGTMRPTERQRRLRLCSVSRACGISAGAVKVKQKEKSVWQPYMQNGTIPKSSKDGSTFHKPGSVSRRWRHYDVLRQGTS